jgi:hypothetical protein
MKLQSLPGSIVEEQVTLINYGKASGTASIYPVDATTSQSGGFAYQAQNTPRRDVGAWITLSKQQITLQPGASQLLTFQLAIPKNAYTGYHLGGIVVEDNKPQTINTPVAGKMTFHVNVVSRQVFPVQVTLPGTAVEQLKMTGIQAGGANKLQTLQVGLENTGTSLIAPTGSLQLMNSSGQQLFKSPIQVADMLPFNTISYPVAIPNKALGPGTYTAQVALTYGHQRTLNTQQTFTITAAQVQQVFQQQGLQAPDMGVSALPLWQIAAIGLLLLLGTLSVLYWGYKISRSILHKVHHAK